MDRVKRVSREEEKEEIAFAADLAAQKRLKTLLDLAISIGQREGLIRNYSENTATETLKASAHDPSACTPSACNEANIPIGNVPRQRFHKEPN
jgi:predicted transcriptional regulator